MPATYLAFCRDDQAVLDRLLGKCAVPQLVSEVADAACL